MQNRNQMKKMSRTYIAVQENDVTNNYSELDLEIGGKSMSAQILLTFDHANDKIVYYLKLIK